MLRAKALSILVALATGTVARAQTEVYVDDSAPAGGDGLSWATAFNNLQSALLPIPPNGTQVRVAQGTYKPAGPLGSRFASFAMAPGLELLGGYAGLGAPNPDARNPALYPSVLSGDLKGDDGPNFVNYAENSFHVVTSDTNASGFTIDGFIIRAGFCNNSTSGAGMSLFKSGPCVVSRCTFVANRSTLWGGGASAQNSLVAFDECEFLDNKANNDGGGLAVFNGSNLTMNDCLIAGNIAGFSGGVEIVSSLATIERCTIENNLAEAQGGGISLFQSAQADIRSCMIRGNIASNGIAIKLEGSSFATVVNSALIDHDSYTPQIGAALSAKDSSFKLINCTIASVHDGDTIAIGRSGSSATEPLVKNSIVYNKAGVPTIQDAGSPKLVAAHSLITDGWPGVSVIDANPRFLNPDAGDYSLSGGSPCIDSADKSAYPPGMPLDLAGNLRFKDDPGMCDTGVGAKPHIDRGAYEFQGTTGPCYPDCDENCLLQIDDFICFQSNFALGLPEADCDADSTLSVDDFICFQTAFAIGC